ncbi:MAG: heme exporter protein CcmD [Devosia nanyangense]|uniref:Heme exporter protein D n=1 Tax=Devosia nanyangense TaxID=1228055 RepID=A0A933NYK7_9HYPH|nr:heme exporter protein CcmD [Devosia nanyangense]
MIDLGPHAVFIISAYVGVIVVTLGLIAWVGAQSARVKSRLAGLEAQGIRRRSAGTAS